MAQPPDIQPSYRSGFAQSAAESLYPEYWRGLFIAFVPALAPGGAEMRELVSRYWFTQHNSTRVCSWAITEYGPAIVPTVSSRSWMVGEHGQANKPVEACTAIRVGITTSSSKYCCGFLHDSTRVKGTGWSFQIGGARIDCATGGALGTYHALTARYDGANLQGWRDGIPYNAQTAATGTLDDAGLREVTIFNRNNRSDYQAQGTAAHLRAFFVWNYAIPIRMLQHVSDDPLCFLRWKRRVILDLQEAAAGHPMGHEYYYRHLLSGVA